MFKKFFKGVWDFCCAVGEARAAAELARNGHWKKAQDLYRN